MVKINSMQSVVENGTAKPLMYRHNLTVKKEAPTFEVGEVVDCYITKYQNNRFAVFSTSGVQNTKYHVFESETELHEHFEEQA